MTPSEALIAEGLKFPGSHICESPVHPLLIQLCNEHATYMAKYQKLGHQLFQQRYDTIRKILGLGAEEIAAMTWDRQKDDSLEEVAKEMFNSWRQSPGHWRTVSRKHKFIGGDMAQGANGIWYGIMIGAN